jgi:hypothetical protein
VHTAAELTFIRQKKREFAAYLTAHWGFTGPESLLVGAHASSQRLQLHCAQHGSISVVASSAWSHYKAGTPERLAQICARCGYGMRGRLHGARRAEALREHYVQRRLQGSIAESVRQRVQHLCQTQQVTLDLSTYAGMHKPWSGVCREHGFFEATCAQGLLKRKYVCPACSALATASSGLLRQLKHFAHYRQGRRDCSARSLFAQEGSGWLYRIDDKATGLQYYGLTQKSVEERFERHRDTAKNPKGHPLYVAMQERPLDFEVQAVAFYRDAACLAQAEREHIEHERTRWPQGYNLSAGGEIHSNHAHKLLSRLLALPLSEKERGMVLSHHVHLERIGITFATWRLRLGRGMSVEQSLTLPAVAPPGRTTAQGVNYPSRAPACAALGLSDQQAKKLIRSGHGRDEAIQCLHAIALQRELTLNLPGRVPISLQDVIEEFRIGEHHLAHRILSQHACALQRTADSLHSMPLLAVEAMALERGVLVRGRLYGTLRKACNAHHMSSTEVRLRSATTGESLAQALEHLLGEKEAARPYREVYFTPKSTRRVTTGQPARQSSVDNFTRPVSAGKFILRGVAYLSPRLAARAQGVPLSAMNEALYAAKLRGAVDPAQVLDELLRKREDAARFVVEGKTYPNLLQACKAAGVRYGKATWYAKRGGVSPQEGLHRAREAAKRVPPTSDEGLARTHLGLPLTPDLQCGAEPRTAPQPPCKEELVALTQAIALARAEGFSVFQVRRRLKNGLPLTAAHGT